ncbi:MAG TPA: hybrid sensor histidine kinase/response regulator [Verrucomicrobiales bacterium]|nr:hybrid sensor histidine kinase/response regulator [Verrucomicrobiales bacterium]
MKRVLVIDDTAEILDVISECLTYQGLETIVAQDGATGIRLAQEKPPDLIICDVNMPGLDGYSVLLALRKIPVTSTIPFIFLTGVADKVNVRRGMELGADDYLTKPFTQKELKAAVSARLEKQAELQRQADRRLDELRGSLTLALPHELRTPLNGIIGLAAILMDDHANCSQDEVLATARDIHASAERLHHLIENFLVFSQIQLLITERKSLAGGDYIPLPAPEVVPELAHSVARRHQREGDLTIECEEVMIQIPGENLRKIVIETLDNAFKFSEPGQPVKLIVRGMPDGSSELVIQDQGRGMTADQIANVGPHIQFDRQKFEQQGAGLGLIISKRMAELLGGEYGIVSRLGTGTTVTIRFPVIPPPADPSLGEAPSRADLDSADPRSGPLRGI